MTNVQILVIKNLFIGNCLEIRNSDLEITAPGGFGVA